MACNSCSTEKGGTPGGCRNNGTCGTGGCNKLNVYNWLSDMTLPQGQKPFDIVEVRFKGSRKEFYRNTENLELRSGDVVAVEASPGHDLGVVSMVGELVRFQLKKKNVAENSDSIRALYRKPKPSEIEKWYELKDKEGPMLNRTREIILALKLSMKLSDIEFQGDGKKATFFYTADDRVDFRELIKKLAEEFRIRIEMRQIGMRQEAGRLGGIGVCGRELCCSTWLTDFKTVSTSSARYQNLALNPAKLAGQCGKLKCCLNYELDSYMDALKNFPPTNIQLETEHGRASHRKTDIFKGLMWYAYFTDDRREQAELAESSDGGNWVMLPVKRVNEIIELNKQKIKPSELRDASVEEEIEVAEPDYANVVGQDRIDRMDKLKKKKKKKKKKSGGGQEAKGPATGATTAGENTVREQKPAGKSPNENNPKPQRPQGPPRQQGRRPDAHQQRKQEQRPQKDRKENPTPPATPGTPGKDNTPRNTNRPPRIPRPPQEGKNPESPKE